MKAWSSLRTALGRDMWLRRRQAPSGRRFRRGSAMGQGRRPAHTVWASSGRTIRRTWTRVCVTPSYLARTAESLGWTWTYWQFDSDFLAWDMSRDDWVEPIRAALAPKN